MTNRTILRLLTLFIFIAAATTAAHANEMYLSPTDCPEGWIKVSDYDNRMPKGSNAYGTQAGSSTTSGPQGSSGYANAGPGNDAGSHTHTIDPPYIALNFCQPVNITLEYNTFQNNGTAIVSNTNTCTSGSRFTQLDNRYPRGAQIAGATGGSFTTSSAEGGSYSYGTQGGNDGNPHTHTADPPHTETIFCEETIYPELPLEMIFMTTTSCPEGYMRYLEMDNKFPKGATEDTLGTSGGSNITSGASGFSFGVRDGGSGGGRGGGHTHIYTPPYYDLVFCQSNSAWNSPPNMTVSISEIIWQNNLTIQINTTDPDGDEVTINTTINQNNFQSINNTTYNSLADQSAYNITITISDGKISQTGVFQRNTTNTAPQIISINTVTGYEDEESTCSYTYDDQENNNVTEEYIWLLNGTNSINRSTIEASNLTAGLIVSCSVRIYDGLDYSNWVMSQNKTILEVPKVQNVPDPVEEESHTKKSSGGSSFASTPQINENVEEEISEDTTIRTLEQKVEENVTIIAIPELIVPSDPINSLAAIKPKEEKGMQINWVVVLLSASISTILGTRLPPQKHLYTK